ncbi:MAG: hypothetical protein AMJ54_14460 [Deltaproteobacteria bacterium SG8_13]|nr:MAG: hypothetical protein AMJ54_14460 [Deltaproteobacteria bacterium SG8_13]
MLVKNWMSKKVITIDVDDSMSDAIRKMREHNVKILPVLKKGRLTGIVTDRDMKRASASDATSLEIHELLYLLSTIKVKDIMSREPVTVPDDFTIEEAADVLLQKKISGAPVLAPNGQMEGIITRSDIFLALLNLSGFGKRGIQFAFEIEDRPGSIKELTDVIRDYGGRMASILSTYEGAAEGSRNVYIRMYGIDRKRMDDLEGQLRSRARMLYMVDHRDNKRKILI